MFDIFLDDHPHRDLNDAIDSCVKHVHRPTQSLLFCSTRHAKKEVDLRADRETMGK